MHTINLKELLLLSIAAKRPLPQHQCFRLGKLNFAVRFELRGTLLSILQVKRISRSPTRLNRLQRHRRRLRKLRPPRTPPKHKATMTEHLELAHESSQTDPLPSSHVGLDTEDLTMRRTQQQQTLPTCKQSRATQTWSTLRLSCATQVQCLSKTRSLQTERDSMDAGVQTDVGSADCCVQTTQTMSDWHMCDIDLNFLILSSLNGQNKVLQDIVIGINRLMEFELLALRPKRMDRNCLPQPSDCSEPDSLEIVDDLLQLCGRKPQQLPQHAKTPIPTKIPTKIHRLPKLRFGQSWNCTLSCKRCGLHMHRSKAALKSSQATQTEAEAAVKVASIAIGTQTYKERGFWATKRNARFLP